MPRGDAPGAPGPALAGTVPPDVLAAYGARAEGYARGQGRLDATPPWQRDLLSRWAERHDGALLDLGCGPGHLTAFLAGQGRTIRGVDPVLEFVRIARRNHPAIPFDLGDAATLPDEEFTGILAWYSLVHVPPHEMPGILATLREHLRPGGGLLLGLFTGDRLREFEHPMARAWAWPAGILSDVLEEAGLVVVDPVTAGPAPLGHGVLTATRV